VGFPAAWRERPSTSFAGAHAHQQHLTSNAHKDTVISILRPYQLEAVQHTIAAWLHAPQQRQTWNWRRGAGKMVAAIHLWYRYIQRAFADDATPRRLLIVTPSARIGLWMHHWSHIQTPTLHASHHQIDLLHDDVWRELCAQEAWHRQVARTFDALYIDSADGSDSPAWYKPCLEMHRTGTSVWDPLQDPWCATQLPAWTVETHTVDATWQTMWHAARSRVEVYEHGTAWRLPPHPATLDANLIHEVKLQCGRRAGLHLCVAERACDVDVWERELRSIATVVRCHRSDPVMARLDQAHAWRAASAVYPRLDEWGAETTRGPTIVVVADRATLPTLHLSHATALHILSGSADLMEEALDCVVRFQSHHEWSSAVRRVMVHLYRCKMETMIPCDVGVEGGVWMQAMAAERCLEPSPEALDWRMRVHRGVNAWALPREAREQVAVREDADWLADQVHLAMQWVRRTFTLHPMSPMSEAMANVWNIPYLIWAVPWPNLPGKRARQWETWSRNWPLILESEERTSVMVPEGWRELCKRCAVKRPMRVSVATRALARCVETLIRLRIPSTSIEADHLYLNVVRALLREVSDAEPDGAR